MKRLVKLLTGALVVALLTLAFAPRSDAHTHFFFGVGVAPYGYAYPYYPYAYPYPYYPYYPYRYYPRTYYAPDYTCDYGYLRTRVTPYNSEVYVDGGYLGRVDELNYRVRLPVGTHNVVFRAPGYKTYALDVYVPPCRTVSVSYNLHGPR